MAMTMTTMTTRRTTTTTWTMSMMTTAAIQPATTAERTSCCRPQWCTSTCAASGLPSQSSFPPSGPPRYGCSSLRPPDALPLLTSAAWCSLLLLRRRAAPSGSLQAGRRRGTSQEGGAARVEPGHVLPHGTGGEPVQVPTTLGGGRARERPPADVAPCQDPAEQPSARGRYARARTAAAADL
eukprot:scaffold1283_cov321-Prasinococcus_capsulatus_cf.AAC.3